MDNKDKKVDKRSLISVLYLRGCVAKQHLCLDKSINIMKIKVKEKKCRQYYSMIHKMKKKM